MSIFNSIRDAIFGSPAEAAEANPHAAPPASPAAGATPPTGTPISKVDVTAVLDNLVKNQREALDWRRSIVDIMKLLNIDSSLKARKELARELNYDGDTSDSAKMNIWLHKQVMTKLAENGGVVPSELKH
jgi:hypothetical protein